VTVRTLDFAEDKLPPFLAERGPLGRSLPLMLADPEALGTQVRAFLLMGATDIRVMVPMVCSAAELRQCRDLVTRIAADLGRPRPPVGAMVETREAIADIDAIATVADFLSVGTNDLSASMLGRDRRDPSLTPSSVREPAVLAAVAATVAAGERHGRGVSVCGDAASDPAAIEVLVGVGCRVLSVAPALVDEVRAVVRSLDTLACRDAAASIIGAGTAI
jgi:phosphoenolpyruvate-protein kinase (PTS system EI component)